MNKRQKLVLISPSFLLLISTKALRPDHDHLHRVLLLLKGRELGTGEWRERPDKTFASQGCSAETLFNYPLILAVVKL